MYSTYYVGEIEYFCVLVFVLLKMVCTDCQTTSYIVSHKTLFTSLWTKKIWCFIGGEI